MRVTSTVSFSLSAGLAKIEGSILVILVRDWLAEVTL